MAYQLGLSILAALISIFFIDANELTAEDIDSIKISLLPDSQRPLLVADKDKPILRYGFHRTHDCQNFEKAFICVRKCLDLNYHIAHANKDCVCTCYKNRILAKFKQTSIDTASTKWKLGAPTTSRPPWAGREIDPKPNDYEINANYTEFVEDLALAHTLEGASNETKSGEATGITDGDGLTGDAEGSGDGGENATEDGEKANEGAVAEGEAEPEAEPEAEHEAEPDAEHEAEHEAEPEAEHEVEPEPEAETRKRLRLKLLR